SIKLKSTVPGSPVYRGPIHCFRTILQKEGIAGVYRGNVAMLLRDVPGYYAYFIPYAMFCDWITPDGSISPNPSSIWVAGGVAGAVSWAVCTPMDVVKSRLQADGVYLNQYKGTLDCMLQSYQNEGVKVFFRGLMVNTVRGFPSSAAMFLGYELSLKAMKRCQTETNS
ncbi:S2548 protein, partial [Mystacornis crossleyi]|nr:S2548 protein [Mystacornis crossleyi]